MPSVNPPPIPDNNNPLSAGTLAAIIVPSVVGLGLLSCLLCYCCKWCCFKSKFETENGMTERHLIRNEINSNRTPVINRNDQMNGFSPVHNMNPGVSANLPSVRTISSVPPVPSVPVITPIIPIKTETKPEIVSPKTNIINTQTSLGAAESINQVVTGRFNKIESNTNNTNTNLSMGVIDNKYVDTNTKIESQ